MMLQYEHERTTDIVNRLVAWGNTIRTVTILVWVILVGVLFSFAVAILEGGLWWLGCIAGIILGYLIGRSVASTATLIIEWLAQMLVAQGEIVSAIKSKDLT